jgi:hypothetical protein
MIAAPFPFTGVGLARGISPKRAMTVIRLSPSQPPARCGPAADTVESEYRRHGTLAYLAAYDVWLAVEPNTATVWTKTAERGDPRHGRRRPGAPDAHRPPS